ncbi:DUF2807 domain-containing protein [Halosquirtibacter xylanolyticus]|uniref:GIN domain-containing protein n=1 Tax=Halosquirtibacter xylanolyticus TaxID=3374599 RepID=UPI00374941EE|nr:DUF2807 domain-containing protein [Prolixibacteraceae bacterium]
MVEAILKSTAIAATMALFFSCSSDNDTTPDTTYYVADYQNILVDGPLNIDFVNGNQKKSSTSTYKVMVEAPDNLKAEVSVVSKDGTLTLKASKEISLKDQIHITVSTPVNISEIKLKSDQTAVFDGELKQPGLIVVTEGHSSLTLKNIEVANLMCKTKGGSELTITTYSEVLTEPQTFSSQRGTRVNETTLLVDNRYTYVGTSVTLEDGSWKVEGDKIYVTYFMNQCLFEADGSTTIDAIAAQSRVVDIQLNGTSSANVYAIEKITGQGKGSSTLYYKDIAGVDITNFITQGAAQVSPYIAQ